jgi:hypothetical protein
MKHSLIKILILLIAISLFMALTGFSTKVQVVLALVNRDALDGEGQESLLTEVEAEIQGSGRTERYSSALNALRWNPAMREQGLTTAFKRTYRINNVTADEGNVIVDFSSRNLKGTMEEELLLISQIVATLTRSFDEVETVSFTVDGEESQTLMGHVDIRSAFRVPPILQ